MVTTGIVGREWRATITPWGGLHGRDGVEFDWYVAADDRWHVPANESAVRQRRIDGTAVTETRVRVPNGDVVQHVYSCADAGGVTVVEVTNESTLPVAIAFSRRDVLTERPIVDVPIEGIDLGPEAFVAPLGHSATLRVGVAHAGWRAGPLPGGMPTALQVARGWTAHVDQASRLVLPDGETGSSLVQRVAAERCELALGALAGDDEPEAFLVGLGELVRMGERPDSLVADVAEAVESVARSRDWASDVALEAAGRVLGAAGERRAVSDLDRITRSRQMSARPALPPDDVLCIPWLESRMVRKSVILPDGVPEGWLGQSIECYAVPTEAGSSVSFAIRWHGERPAVLWEQHGDPQMLSSPLAPEWTTDAVRGETLWPAPMPGL